MSTATLSHIQHLRSSVEKKISDHLSPDDLVCISRVPDGLRKVNPPCYTPRLVAIGPLHCDNPQLKPMEDMKLKFLQEFYTNINIDGIITFIMDTISWIRYLYGESKKLPKTDDLCEMMLLDSVFIIQIFLKKENKHPMFDNYWWVRDLMHDLLLIENQIPLVIPCTIYCYYYFQPSGKHYRTSFTSLAKNFFNDIEMASASLSKLAHLSDISPLTKDGDKGKSVTTFSSKPSHFVEFLMMAYFPLSKPSQPVFSQLDSTPSLPLTQKKSNKKGGWKFGVATASRLLKYGVKFEVNTTTSLVEIQFKEGILKIPRIKVDDWTETLFSNLIAFEQCQHLTPRHVTDYIIFMDSLIDTPEDVNILTNNGIIQDALQDPEKVTVLFNNLYKEVITENRHYHFAQLSRELNDYRKDRWHQWKAKWYNWKVILRRDYFNSPWSTISFIAAVIALGLTLVQTVCSIYQAQGTKI